MNKIFSIFRKIIDSVKRTIADIRRDDDERGCWNCKHTNKGFDEDPCCWCDKYCEWEERTK